VSVDTTLAALKTVFATIATPQPFAKIYDDPKEATSIGEFPCAILTLAPQVDHTWRIAAHGLGRHDYTVAAYVFVGHRQTQIGELHSRAIQWPKPIADVLMANLTLSGAVEWIGDTSEATLFTYQMGPIQWGLSESETYFGLKLLLPVTEKMSQEMP
jgi:hypothetical protein